MFALRPSKIYFSSTILANLRTFTAVQFSEHTSKQDLRENTVIAGRRGERGAVGWGFGQLGGRRDLLVRCWRIVQPDT